MRVRKKKWAEPYLHASSFVLFDTEQLTRYTYGANYAIHYLEIGVGKGDFFVHMAIKHPFVFFVGIELNLNIAALTAKKIADHNLTNVLLIVGDARKVMPKLAPMSFERVILNHSDPWPKKRHAKRRLTFPTFLNLYYMLLKKDGTLTVKTDNTALAMYSLETIKASPFVLLASTFDYDGQREDDFMTEYEAMFRAQGVKIKLIEAKKE